MEKPAAGLFVDWVRLLIHLSKSDRPKERSGIYLLSSILFYYLFYFPELIQITIEFLFFLKPAPANLVMCSPQLHEVPYRSTVRL